MLDGKLVFNDKTVFSRLKTYAIPSDFVAACVNSIPDALLCDIETIKDISSEATTRGVENSEERASITIEERLERAMYEPLVSLLGVHYKCDSQLKSLYYTLQTNILNYIALFPYPGHIGPGVRGPDFNRVFATSGQAMKPDEAHVFGFPNIIPDITVLANKEAIHSPKWHYRDWFGEVKPSKKQGPDGTNQNMIPAIVAQAADYARLFLSARPLMLYCVGILIFGTNFCVGIFDRGGITFSPVYDMFEDITQFVKVIITLSRYATIDDLGMDPTVTPLDEAGTFKLTRNANPTYPSNIIYRVGLDKRMWCTVGPPMWISMSLMGRGTNVWFVPEYVKSSKHKDFLTGSYFVMKTAWRMSSRNPESSIYQAVDPLPVGVARFICGGDVDFPGTNFRITVDNIRNPEKRTEPGILNPTPVLHRIVLGTIGRPLWTYKSDLELLMGLRDAIFGTWSATTFNVCRH